MMNTIEFLEHVNRYRASKGKDLICPDDLMFDPMSRCIGELDLLIREHSLLVDRCLLDMSEDEDADKARIDKLTVLIEEAKEAIVNDPDSNWTKPVLEYRIRQEHYK